MEFDPTSSLTLTYDSPVARISIPEGDGGDAVQLWTLRPEMGAAVNRLVDAAYNKSILPARVREAARMRIAQLNDCTVCLAFRADKVKAQGLTEEFYCRVGDRSQQASFTPRELLAIEYAERFAVDHLSIDDDFVHQLCQEFSDAEILDLTICLSAFLGLGRTLRVLGITETSLTDI
jgi:AhpD family alkylhydroperoxidase